jgi:hypothetical protein
VTASVVDHSVQEIAVMEKTLRVVNLEENETLTTLAEEVASTRHRVLLRKHGQDIAVISPVTDPDDADSAQQDEDAYREAFIRSAGGWKGLVDEELLDEIYRSRSISTRDPVDL